MIKLFKLLNDEKGSALLSSPLKRKAKYFRHKLVNAGKYIEAGNNGDR
jgi:hypothetical protein